MFKYLLFLNDVHTSKVRLNLLLLHFLSNESCLILPNKGIQYLTACSLILVTEKVSKFISEAHNEDHDHILLSNDTAEVINYVAGYISYSLLKK